MPAATVNARSDTSITGHWENHLADYNYDRTNSEETANSFHYWLGAEACRASMDALHRVYSESQEGSPEPMRSYQEQKFPRYMASSCQSDLTDILRLVRDKAAESVGLTRDGIFYSPAVSSHGGNFICWTVGGEKVDLMPADSVSDLRAHLVEPKEFAGCLLTKMVIHDSPEEVTFVAPQAGRDLLLSTASLEKTWKDHAAVFAIPDPVRPDLWRRTVYSRSNNVIDVDVLGHTILVEPTTEVDNENEIVKLFAQGLLGKTPTPDAVETARAIVQMASQKAVAKEVEFDEDDGFLSFELRLESGLLVVGELTLEGNLEANVYNDQNPDAEASIMDIWLQHLPNATKEDLFGLV